MSKFDKIFIAFLISIFAGIGIAHASQGFVVLPTSTPPGLTGLQLASDVNAIGSSSITTNLGTSAPSYAIAGTQWTDSTNHLLKFYDGSTWLSIGGYGSSTWSPLGVGTGLTGIGTASLSASGTANSTTYLRGDNTWGTVSSGSGTVTSSTAGQVAYYQSSAATVIGTSTMNISGGSVGIGTTTPDEKLQITGIIDVTGGGAVAGSGPTGFAIGYNPANYGWIQTYSNQPLALNGIANPVVIGGTSADANMKLTVKGALSTNGSISNGTKFTTSGCSISSTTGGATAGKFTLGANNCMVVITMNGATGLSAPNGWHCSAEDLTAPTILTALASSTAATASISIPVTAGTTDVISFSCMGY